MLNAEPSDKCFENMLSSKRRWHESRDNPHNGQAGTREGIAAHLTTPALTAPCDVMPCRDSMCRVPLCAGLEWEDTWSSNLRLVPQCPA